MSEHADKGHPIGAFIMLLIICGLVVWGIGLMNDGNSAAAAGAAVLLFGTGAYGILGLARD
ncbi:MAG: hypothetical protein IPO93_00655 [Actinobacteria bacterium]|jgi:hypothetical protein|nr:hypothetical protein [Actinomycetota bacterium]